MGRIVYDPFMTTVSEIESAISSLPEDEFWKLAEWFDEKKSDAWDARIEADAAAGKLDRFAEAAIREHLAGKTIPLP